jgi:uncharacterized protein (TIGR01244 family)
MTFSIILATASLFAQEGAKIAPVTVGQTPNSSTYANRVYFAGQIAKADVDEYAKLGVKKVINLRTSAEMEKLGFDEATAVKAAGMEYLSVPMPPGELPSETELKKIYSALGISGEQKVLLHCGSSNRVGMIWALYRGSEQGLGVEDAIAEGKQAGMKAPALEKLARAKLAK